MSLFNVEDEEIKETIDFFNSLTDEERALIVSDLNPHTFKMPQYYEDLVHLFSLIQRDITIHDGIRIGNRLMELGLEETWARLLVANIKKHAPTIKYQISQLNRIDEQVFVATFGKIMDALWVHKIPDDEVTEKFGIDTEQIHCITDMTSHYMQDMMRGDNTEASIREALVENGLSAKRADTLLRALKDREDDWYRWLIFRNAQDNYYAVQEVKDQNTAILETLREILVLLKEQKSGRNMQ